MLRVHNTMTRTKEPFEPAGDPVTMYVCGPTVYNYIHIGNGRADVVFDVIRRYLSYSGHRVRFVKNITDVDDRIIERSAAEGRPFSAVGQSYTEAYLEDQRALNVTPPDFAPKASEHIPEMISMIETLIENGHAYASGGDVYFDIRASDDYCKLSGHSVDELRAGARVEPDERKRDPLDFALWKASKEGEPWWDSPWGRGRPGWHIECSAMSTAYLGDTIDIHGGGHDLIFPHHENEIQQAEKATGTVPFVRYWLHNGWLTIDQEKMSKSLGNTVTVRDLLQHYHPMILRFFLLNTHYRKPLDFNHQALDEATEGYLRIFNAYHQARRVLGLLDAARWPFDGDDDLVDAVEALDAAFDAAMDDDFNTREAIAAVFEFTRSLNERIESLSRHGLASAMTAYELIDNVLGILAPVPHDEAALEGRALEREAARARRDFRASDAIRDSLAAEGVMLQDAKGYTRIVLTRLPPTEAR
ncbi:MAG: cysteine--tRNA ligase [Thermoplasmata archaeon]|nr:cysteine--tRNA ligase [Thermoplasmata archaeon]